MVKRLTIGIIGFQGAISEHLYSIKQIFRKKNYSGKAIIIKDGNDINDIDGLILPGGESTTISKILNKSGLHDVLKRKIQYEKLPVMGTCAGCILLARKIENNSEKIKLLNSMDMEVKRNAYGRQVFSFEKDIHIEGFDYLFNAVFIRAPSIEKVWNNCKPLAIVNKKIVMARQENLLALTFHPELTNDLRVHQYFLDMI